ncbi:MAG: efflux RND transporter periplasmic adaptor subunit [Pricia sp.]
MNKSTLYIGIAVIVGLLAGYLIFGGTADDTMDDKNNLNMSDSHDHSGETAEEMWTCSMHPQIMQPEPGDCPICGMDLIPAESSGEGLAMNQIKMTENAMALANVRTTVVGNAKAEGNNTISLSGKIKMNEEANAIQASYFDGRIERLNVDYEGQEVRKGQLLATLYAPDLIAAQQELITAASLKESQPSLYKAVRNKLKLWKLSENQINAIEESEQVKEDFPIYANVSGTVSEKMASEGDYVKQGQPILKVSNLNSVWAEFDAYENQISQFKKGQDIKIVSNAYPNQTFNATVSFIDPVLNTQTRTVTIRAVLKNKDGIFKPGMFVTGKIKSNPEYSSEQLSIPASAVLWTGERSLVYLKTDPYEPVFEMREVSLANRNGDTYTIASGLQNGDEIVTNGTFTVDAAAQLQGKRSMMNQDRKGENVEMAEMNLSDSGAGIKLSKNIQDAFKKSMPSYLKMKDAFVEGDSEKVSEFAVTTLDKITTIPESELGTIEKSHFTKIKTMLASIAESDTIEKQRDHFVILNRNMVPMVMNIEEMDPEIFIQKCPMANNNNGAFWISADEEIRNPYYGEQMMTCGSIIETIN